MLVYVQQGDHILEELLGEPFVLSYVVIEVLVDLQPDFFIGHFEVSFHHFCVVPQLMVDVALGL